MDGGRSPDDDATSIDPGPAREVTSGPPCPGCKFPMEPGFVVLESGGSLAARLGWYDPDPQGARPGEMVETLPWGPLGGTRSLRGFRCPECQRLELWYGTPHPPAP
jgi:hypothetical protein